MVGMAEYRDWFDSDGRLVKEAQMRQRVFEAGTDPSCRRSLWKFLFGIYPMTSTHREQKTIDIENRAHYQALRRRWVVLDATITLPDDDLVHAPPYMELSDGDEDKEDSNRSPLAPESRLSSDSASGGTPSGNPGTDCEGSGCVPALKPKGLSNGLRPDRLGSFDTENRDRTCSAPCPSPTTKTSRGVPECPCDFRKKSYDDVLDEEGRALLQILEFPAKVHATRQAVDLEKSYPKAKRIILRDVLRTDRNFHYFSHKRNLRKVHRILMVYAMFHPEMGYAQGMNDLLARFLVVTDSEVDSYWMFVRYMERKMPDFLEQSMMKKVALVKSLIHEVDEALFDFFERSECKDYLFCHRWLLLDFKREFDLEDSLRMFEVLGTHYLELTSDKALLETDKAIAKEFELDGGEARPGRAFVNLEFTFDLFVCVAILTMHSKDICKATDAASVYGCLNNLSMNMNLNKILTQAEELFYKYCKLTITKGFCEISI